MDRKQLYKLEQSVLFDDDFKVFSEMIKFKDNKHKYNTKQQLKGYDDKKIIKQLFNLCIKLMDEKHKDDKLQKLINRIDKLQDDINTLNDRLDQKDSIIKSLRNDIDILKGNKEPEIIDAGYKYWD